ncbi:MAG: outer membrane protein transport protein [candidate division Zixibacteria bacterium]|nr:outer membrane protein transport protein [candidate division Zixibacteria bacterium]
MRKLFLLSLLMCLAQAVLVSGSGITVPGIGDRATGMGGAFRALANDWSAAWWNPAGLAYLQTSEFTAQLMAFSPRPNFTPNITAGSGAYPVGYLNGTEWNPKDRHFFYPNAGGFYKFPNKENFNAGIAILFPYGMGSRWDLFEPLPGYNNTVAMPAQDHEITFVIVDIHPSIAKEVIKDKLSVGLGLSIQNGDLAYQRVHLISAADVIAGGLERPYDNFVMDSKTELNGWGWGLNLGTLLKVSPKLNLALTLRTGVTISMSGKTSQQVFFPKNDELVAADTSLAPYLSGGAASNSPDLDSKLKLPAEIGFGIALFPSERFTLTADLSWTDWSRFDAWDFDYKTGSTVPGLGVAPPSKVALNWDNVTSFGIGVEYLAKENLKVRAGYSSDPTPIPDQTLSPAFVDYSDKSILNIGTSYFWDEYEIGYNFEYINFQNRTITGYSDVNGDGVFDNYPGEYTSTLYGSHFYFTYRF